ncbi:MAG: hypothetical protein Q8P41_16450 [Pseudomonadota bacterium]|nr:hypothetical protein [Pseudomonadota bacterium]
MEDPAAGHRLVVVADIVSSRRLDVSARRAVQERVLALCGAHSAFRVSGGDEFEWSLSDAPASLDRLLWLRLALGIREGEAPGVEVRCGIGRGEVRVSSTAGPYAEDGPGYHRARAAMERLRAPPARSRRSTSDPLEPGAPRVRRTAWVDEAPNPERDALLLHMDHLFVRWSAAQRTAVAQVLSGATYEEIGGREGISAQAVQARIKVADLSLHLVGHAALKNAWRAS